jgi:hypothetical protein
VNLLHSLFLNPTTRRLRSGWRVLVFFVVLSLPSLVMSSLFAIGVATSAANTFAVDWVMIAVYAVTCGWVALISIACFHWLDGVSWRAMGYALHQGWSRNVALGLVVGFSMIAFVVACQWLGGGTTLRWTFSGAAIVCIFAATILLWLAAAFEELLFRGYAFQTLLRDVPAWVPVLLLAGFFGMAHWSNPSRTNYSTLNTALAGVWLAAAVLRTRSLWLATALHFSWNWTMGVLFGLPVSGMRLPQTIFFASSEAPPWLTGGSYGSEGGVVATLAFGLATWWLWRSGSLRVAPETGQALTTRVAEAPDELRLNLS